MRKLFISFLLIIFSFSLLAETKDPPFYHYLKGLFYFYESEFSLSEIELLKALEEKRNSYLFAYLAEIYLHKFEWEKAEKMAESALKINPSNINALLTLGNIYLAHKRGGRDGRYLEKAEEIYKKIISIDPTLPEPYYILGKWIYLPLSKWEEAEEVLKKYAELFPYKDEAYLLLGEVATKAGNYNEAELYFKKALEINPGSFLAYSYLGELYREKKEISKEINIYKFASEIFTQNPIFFQRLAEAYLEKNDPHEALKTIEKAISLSPFSSELLLTKSKILMKLQKFDDSINTLNKILEINPNFLEAKIYLLENFMQIYEYKKATQILLDLEKVGDAGIPKRELYKTLGYLFTLMKDYKSAKFYLGKAWEYGKDDLIIYSYLSYIYRELGEKHLALKMAEEGLKINPKNKPLIINKIFALSDLEKSSEAWDLINNEFKKSGDLDFLFTGISIFIEKKDWKKGEEYINSILKRHFKNEELYLRIGNFYEKMGKFEKAEKALKKAISLNPSFGNALNYLAYSWAIRDKNLEKALELANKAVKLDPENPDYLDTLGWIYFKMGKIEEAEKYLEKAFSKKPWEPEILEHLGFLKIKKERIEEGINFLEKSLEMSSEKKEHIRKIIKEAKEKQIKFQKRE